MAEQILASYVIENVRNAETGETFCRRTCTDFSAFELLGMLDFARHDIYEQITKRDLVDRVRIEYRNKEDIREVKEERQTDKSTTMPQFLSTLIQAKIERDMVQISTLEAENSVLRERLAAIEKVVEMVRVVERKIIPMAPGSTLVTWENVTNQEMYDFMRALRDYEEFNR